MEILENIVPGSVKELLDAGKKQQNHDISVDDRILSVRNRESLLSHLITIGIITVFAVLLFKSMIKEAMVFGGFLGGLAALVQAFNKRS